MSFLGIPNKPERLILKNVKEYGCHIWSIFGDEGNEPEFAYSVGFTQTVKQPEVIIFGLDKLLMQQMINEVLHQMRDGLKLTDGMSIHNLIEGYFVIAKEITNMQAVEEHLLSAIWFWKRHNKEPMPKPFQLVWPGAVDGFFPWEPACDAFVIDSQPALYGRGTLH